MTSHKSAGIYECNVKCHCNVRLCKNRVVGACGGRGTRGGQKGSVNQHYPVQVFRTAGGKGWGIRCKVDIPLGAYVSEYVGEVLRESVCEARGEQAGDEYLMICDAWAKSKTDEKRGRLNVICIIF